MKVYRVITGKSVGGSTRVVSVKVVQDDASIGDDAWNTVTNALRLLGLNGRIGGDDSVLILDYDKTVLDKHVLG